MSAQQFETFWAILEESNMDYEEHKEELKKAFLKSVPKVKNTQTQTTEKSHKLSGYNVFMSETMKGGKKMTEAVAAWKELSQKEKDEWNVKAKEKNDSGEIKEEKTKKTDKIRKTHKKSGYNLYMSDCMKVQKMKMADVPSWKELAETEKKKWNDKAILENNKAD